MDVGDRTENGFGKESDLDEAEYVIGYKDSAGRKERCENEVVHKKRERFGTRSGARVGRRLETR